MQRLLLISAVLLGTSSALSAQGAPDKYKDLLWAPSTKTVGPWSTFLPAEKVKPVEKKEPTKEPEDEDVKTFSKARTDALRLNRPLVVFVNHKVRGIQGAVCCQLDALNDDDSPRIVIYFTDGKELKAGWNLEASATDADIRRWATSGTREVKVSPDPFSSKNARPEDRDEDNAAGQRLRVRTRQR